MPPGFEHKLWAKLEELTKAIDGQRIETVAALGRVHAEIATMHGRLNLTEHRLDRHDSEIRSLKHADENLHKADASARETALSEARATALLQAQKSEHLVVRHQDDRKSWARTWIPLLITAIISIVSTYLAMR